MAQLKTGTTIGGRDIVQELDSHKADDVSHITAQERISWNDAQETINDHVDRKSSKTEYGHVKIGGSALSITDGVVSLEFVARPSDENLVASAPKEVSESTNEINPSFKKVKEVRINDTGIIRVKYDLRSSRSDTAVIGDIRINGVSVGGTDRVESTSYVTQTRDIEVQKGDSVELWIKPLFNDATAYARNFNIYYTMGLPSPDVSSPNIVLD